MQDIKWNGKPIDKPGIYSDVPMEVYHSQKICVGPSVSSSGLRTLFNKSPAHFYAEWSGNPNCVEKKDKKHLALGRAVHHLALGEADFAKHFVVRPDEIADPKTGEMKPWHMARHICQEWCAVAADQGLTVLSLEQLEAIRGMSVNLMRERLVRDYGILRGLIERSIIWRDEATGLWLKARPDVIPTGSGDFADLKTTSDIHNVGNSISEYRYDMQAALVEMGALAVTGKELSSFSFVFLESTAPYCVHIAHFERADLMEAVQDVRAAANTVARCLKSGNWFGPAGPRGQVHQAHLTARAKAFSKSRREALQRENE